MRDVYIKQNFKSNSKCLIYLAMAYIAIGTACDVLGRKIIGIDSIILSGSAIFYPMCYMISDIVAEIYGYKIMKGIIWFGLIFEILFAIIVVLVIKLPGINTPIETTSIIYTLSPVLRYVLSCVIGDICSSFANIYIISKLKVSLHGKMFWVRCLFAMAVSELIMSIFVISLKYVGGYNVIQLLKMSLYGYLFLMIVAIILVIPTTIIMKVLKKIDNVDVYDKKIKFNPFI